jgi:hypothetical protein
MSSEAISRKPATPGETAEGGPGDDNDRSTAAETAVAG